MGIEDIKNKLERAERLKRWIEDMGLNCERIKNGELAVFLNIAGSQNSPAPSSSFKLKQFGLDLYIAKMEELKAELAKLEELFERWEDVSE